MRQRCIIMAMLLHFVAADLSSQGGFQTKFRTVDGVNHISRDSYEIPGGTYLTSGVSTIKIGNKYKSRHELLALDSNGDTLWRKVYGEALTDFLDSPAQRRSSVLVPGALVEAFTLGADTFSWAFGTLIKTDFFGNMIWQRYYYDSARHLMPRCVTATHDGGFVLAGQLLGGGAPAFLLKTDAAGNEEWRREIITSPDNFSQIQAIAGDSATGKIIVAGFKNSGGDAHDFLVIFDSIGNEVFRGNRYGTNVGGWYDDIVQTSDKKFVGVGSLTDLGFNLRGSPFAYKFDVNDPGTAIWELASYRGYSLVNTFDVVTELNDQSILVSGVLDTLVEIKQHYNWMAHLVRLDGQTGAIIWEKCYNYELDSTQWNLMRTVCVNPTSDNGWILSVRMENVDNNPLMYVKFDSTGCDQPLFICQGGSGTAVGEMENNRLVIGPNPVYDKLRITGHKAVIDAKIVSITGEHLYAQEVNVPGEMDVSFLPAGVYTVILSDDVGKSQITKLVKAAN